MGGTYDTHGKKDKYRVWLKNLKVRGRLQDVRVAERIIFKWVLNGLVWSNLMWLRIGTAVGLLET